MAIVVRITPEQLQHIVDELEAVEDGLKDLYQQMHVADVPGDVMQRFSHLHERHSNIVDFVRKQRELAGPETG